MWSSSDFRQMKYGRKSVLNNIDLILFIKKSLPVFVIVNTL